MTSRTLCYLDRNACGDGLSIDDGGLVVTTNRNALNFERAVRGNLPVRDGEFSFEYYFWSKSRGSLANLLSIGVSQPHASLSAYVGDQTLSWGFRPAEGQIWNNSASVATVAAVPERICCAVSLSLTPGFCSATWHVNRDAIHTAVLPNGKAWLPAISLGAAEAGDLSAVFNFGQHRYDKSLGIDAWALATRGIATVYLAASREGFLSDPTDTPANQSFGPFLLDLPKFHVKRAPKPWPQSGGTDTIAGSYASAAFATLRGDNSEGHFNALLDADVRDAIIVFQVMDAPARGAGSLLDATTTFTACLDRIDSDGLEVEIRLRDTLARLNKPLRCRVIPPFADPSSAGRIWPVSLGATRNVQPLLIDEPTLTYGLGDAPMTNVPLVADGGATLDRYASPPQIEPALDNAGFRLDTNAQKRLSADCTTVGEQFVIPGAEDVLSGIGAFTTWSGGVPSGWLLPTSPTFPPAVPANGHIQQTSSYGSPSALMIFSNIPLNPSGSNNYYFGYPVPLATTPLLPGRTYRISVRVLRVLGTPDQYLNESYGFCILTKMSSNARYWVTPHMVPVTTSGFTGTVRTFDYTVPATEPGPLGLYLTAVSRTGNLSAPTSMSCVVVVDDVRVQLRGQYLSIPMDGITLTQAFRELLVVREGEPEGIFSTADTEAIDAATGILIGVRWVEPPNISAALQEIADTFGAMVYTDANNVIRVRQFADPELGTVVAAFDSNNVLPGSVFVGSDDAPGLTTNAGCRRNQDPFSPGDFVSDTDGVPATQREQWQGTSQFRFSSPIEPAAEYSHARGAPRFHMLSDQLEPSQREFNRVQVMYANPRAGSAGLGALPSDQVSGKRKTVEWAAKWDGPLLGMGPAIAPHELMGGNVVRLHVPEEGVTNKKVGILEWDRYDFGRKIMLLGHYR